MGTLAARIGIFCCFLISFCTISGSSSWAVQKASIVICAETGKVLHEQNADAPTPPASLTKMMTLYLTFKALQEGKLRADQKLLISKHASLAAPCKLGLKPGSTITVRDAIMGMVTKSANDASIVVAEALGKGSEVHFTTLMTQQARQLGMSKTVFKNSHGLPNKPHSITSARDMAILSRCLYKHFPDYFKVFKEEKFVYKGQVHANHNRLLGKVPGLDGIKTGFINASGFNLAASVVRNNKRIIAVVMGGESTKARNDKMVKLLEAAYSPLGGKHGPHKRDDCSIGDLICSLSPTQATPIRAKMHRAVYREQCQPKLIQAKFTARSTTIDDFLDALPEHKPTLKKSKSSMDDLLDDLPEHNTLSKKSMPSPVIKEIKKIAERPQKSTPSHRTKKLDERRPQKKVFVNKIKKQEKKNTIKSINKKKTKNTTKKKK